MIIRGIEDEMTITKTIEELPLEEIPFMNWGTVTPQNFEDSLIDNIPAKRWDCLRTIPISLSIDGKFYEIDKKEGFFTLVSPVRGERPKGMPTDVLGEIVEGKDYAIVVSKDTRPASNPLSNPKKEDLKDCTTVTIVNRYPAYLRLVSDPDLEQKIRSKIENHYTHVARGINLVSFPTKYYERLEDVPLEEVVSLMGSMSRAIEFVKKTVYEETKRLNREQPIIYIPVYVFFNIGEEVGGTLKRIHSQVYMDLTEDGHGQETESLINSFEYDSKNGGCRICRRGDDTVRERDTLGEGDFGGRIIYENNSWILWATGSPERNYHLRFTVKKHINSIIDLTTEDFLGLADILHRSFVGLNQLNVNPNRNIFIRTRPIGYISEFHLFGEIVPHERIGGYELMEDCRVARKHPNETARELREILAY